MKQFSRHAMQKVIREEVALWKRPRPRWCPAFVYRAALWLVVKRPEDRATWGQR